MNNTFATKVSIMNEFNMLCNKIGANWEDAIQGLLLMEEQETVT